MHNGYRQMLRATDGSWVVKCRLCGKRSKRKFDTARQCHDFWREHDRSDQHMDRVRVWERFANAPLSLRKAALHAHYETDECKSLRLALGETIYIPGN